MLPFLDDNIRRRCRVRISGQPGSILRGNCLQVSFICFIVFSTPALYILARITQGLYTVANLEQIRSDSLKTITNSKSLFIEQLGDSGIFNSCNKLDLVLHLNKEPVKTFHYRVTFYKALLQLKPAYKLILLETILNFLRVCMIQLKISTIQQNNVMISISS